MEEVDRESAIGEEGTGDDRLRIELHVLISIGGVAGHAADELAPAGPHVELLAVPISTSERVGRGGGATDVGRDVEFKLQIERALAAPLDHAASVSPGFRDGNPEGNAAG